jgi:cytochrome c oxidase subunit 1
MMNEGLGKIHFWISLIGVYAIFMPMHFLGVAGHPRRYAQLTEFEYLKHLQPLHLFITVAAFVTVGAQLIFVYNFFVSMWRGKLATINPWEATSLEWIIPSPPPHDNFGAVEPVVHHGPYEFSVPGAPADYVLQTAPAEEKKR